MADDTLAVLPFSKRVKREIKRNAFQVLLLVLMLIALAHAPAERYGWQQLMYKVILANAGFLNGHIVRKLAFPAINWTDDYRGPTLLKLLALALYVMFIYAYTQGG